MAEKVRLIDCQGLAFSPALSERRIARAAESFGFGVIRRILCFALYLLGLERSAIGRSLGIPSDTAKSIIKAILRDGLAALEDRRRSTRFRPPAPLEAPPIHLREAEEQIVVDFGFPDRQLKLSRQDPLQVKTVLLSMLNSGLSLVDQRQGQQQDFVVSPSVKAELIQQFAVEAIRSGRTSSRAISEKLKERCSLDIPDRTVRHHLSRMGLRRIKHSLPQLLAAVKKTSKNCSAS